MKPKEGTILTVAKGMADKAAELAPQTEDVLEFSEKVLEHGEYVLSQTPEMLPVLKEAGVVDSGGQGLIQVIKGCIEGLKGKVVDIDAAVTPSVSGNGAAKQQQAPEARRQRISVLVIVRNLLSMQKNRRMRRQSRN